MGLPVRTVTHYEKWVTLFNMCQTMKNVSHCEEWVTLKNWSLCKMGHNVKKMSHTENGSHCEKWATVKNGTHREKRVTV